MRWRGVWWDKVLAGSWFESWRREIFSGGLTFCCSGNPGTDIVIVNGARFPRGLVMKRPACTRKRVGSKARVSADGKRYSLLMLLGCRQLLGGFSRANLRVCR